ncbi:MAG: LCP family protein, partial [Candidatus Limnocylindria bacterium]
MTDRTRTRHPALAALLSFIFPGVGQAYAGHASLALLLAAPVLLAALAGLAIALAWGDQIRNNLLSDTFLSGLLILDVALMAWRTFAIAQVGFARAEPAPGLAMDGGGGLAVQAEGGGGSWRRAGTLSLVVLLILLTVAMHAWAGFVVSRLNRTLGDVFSGAGRGGLVTDADEGPLNVPEYAWDGTERINILLLGVDSGPGREQALTDTILVVSVDPVARSAVMVSVPRDTGFVPLSDGTIYPEGLYPRKVNELASEAGQDPERWCPDLEEAPEACGIRTLERSIGLYLGIPIQYYAQVDLEGFRSLIDAVGGLQLCLPGPLVDPEYTGAGVAERGIQLPAGCTHYDGARALAYARIRKGWIDLPDGTREQQDDFKRAERQQLVLLELRREFARLDLFFELPAMLEAIGDTVSTDFPRD